MRRTAWETYFQIIIASLCLNLAFGREGDSFDWLWGALALLWFIFAAVGLVELYVEYQEWKRKAQKR